MAVNEAFPGWHIWTNFISSYILSGFRLDSLDSTHPVDVPIYEASRVAEVFDLISYNKVSPVFYLVSLPPYQGSSLIFMLANYLGPKKFQEGMQQYIAKHQWGYVSMKKFDFGPERNVYPSNLL
jgi:aminopeptidase N